MEMGKKIWELRTKLGLSQGDLAEMVGYIDRSSIAKVESGKVDLPASKVTLFAKALKTTETYLLGLEDDEDIYKNASIDYVRIPLYSPICCGNGGFNEDNIIEYVPVPSSNLSPKKEYFCQYAEGESMKGAGISNGDLLVFEKTSSINNGIIGCFCIDDNKAMCKKYTIVGKSIILMPMNSEYEPIAVEIEKFRCVGILKKVIKDF